MSVQISVRVSKEQKEKLVDLAKNENKTITQYIVDRCIVEDSYTDASNVDDASNRIETVLQEQIEQIRADLSITLTDKSEEALDRLFPVLLSEGATRNYGLKELSMEEKISGIVVTIHTSEGKEVMKDYTLTELKQKVTAARAKQAADPESLVIGLKIEKGCKMGYVTDTKQVLRECSALKINYSTDN